MKVDGNDVEAVFDAAAEACERARAGGGPTLIEAETMRMHGHGAHDDMRYVPHGDARGVGAARPDRDATRRGCAPTGSTSTRSARRWPRSSTRETEWALAQPMPDPATATEGVFATEDPVLGDGAGAVVALVREEASHA